ncbi:tumor protein p53 inducible nuclear protein isoform X1 [Haematobia irritans]|uniref:tumor protein p53 inducible nuclear protein isoform X1 n=1 Tax=Haematobia irritans TaxID=7368 RepID=UPI003F4F7087
MLSSIASYLFGSNTTDTTPNKEAEESGIGSGVEEVIDSPNNTTVDIDNLIEVTSLTPSVTGADPSDKSAAARAIRRGKNKRNNTRQQNKRKSGVKSTNTSESGSTNKSITKLSSSPSDSCDEDFDEDEWFIVEKEDDENEVSLPGDKGAGLNTATTIEIVKSVKPPTIAPSPLAQQRRLQHINSHSLYSGPRPQKQRNHLQKSRGNNNTHNNSSRNSGLSVSTLSPSRTVKENRNGQSGLTADGGMTRSLYVVAPTQKQDVVKAVTAIGGTALLENAKKMDESWFVTPPPCFTSIGPINMEATPYENLLIEHPSMSVYHSIKTAQDATESFVKLDLSVKEPKENRPAKENVPRKNSQAVQQRSPNGFRLDRQSVAQLKQELLARTVQKTQSKKDRKDICRSAIKRANKVRDVQSKNHASRRSDRQHFKVVSSANNNRKSNCY